MDTQLKLFPEPKVIGLYSSVMGSGKSEVAKILVRDYGATLIKFAAPLKDMTRVLLGHMGVDPSEIERRVEGDLKEAPIEDFRYWDMGSEYTMPLTTRFIMQTLGTEWGRDTIDPNFWSKITRDRILSELRAGHSVVLDDMRFYQEYDMISDFESGLTVKVHRPSALRTNTHASEGALDKMIFDWTIDNSMSLAALKANVDEMMEKFS
jgi:hypothetical protein